MPVLGFLKNRRRAQLRSQIFPEEWHAAIERSIAFFPRLSPNDQEELLGHVQVFLAEKGFEGCAGLIVSDEMRAVIAAQACLLLLHRKTDYFPRLLTILLYPTAYTAQEKRPVDQNVIWEGREERLGETGERMRSLVLAWDAVTAGAADASDGRNVVFHEFAHQLDFEDYSSDGVPLLSSREQERSWGSVMRVEFASLQAADNTGIPTLLDRYGATNPAEFFAVAVEAFFERPKAMKNRHPQMYEQLQRYFKQDPKEYSAEEP